MTRLVGTVFVIALAASTALPAAPAAAQENTIGGAIIGGLLGAGIGGAIGRGGGAVVGGVIGATTGALIGSQHDRWRYGTAAISGPAVAASINIRAAASCASRARTASERT